MGEYIVEGVSGRFDVVHCDVCHTIPFGIKYFLTRLSSHGEQGRGLLLFNDIWSQ